MLKNTINSHTSLSQFGQTSTHGENAGLLGFTAEELVGLTYSHITHPEDVEKEVELTKQIFAGVIPNFRIEKRLVKQDREIVGLCSSRP